MKKLKQRLSLIANDYLTYNKAEQRGILVMSAILTVLALLNFMIPSGTWNKLPSDNGFDKEVAEFLQAWRLASDSDSIARAGKYMPQKKSYHGPAQASGNYPGSTGEPLLVELNAADTFDLQQLRGIGPGFARRIVGYRKKLGGYHHREQLLEVFGMDSSRYLAIRDHVTVNKDSIKPMNINQITFKELMKHPYFPFQITKSIMLYRQKHKRFATPEELRQVEGITDSVYRRISVYIRI